MRKPRRPSATATTTMPRRWALGTPPVPSNLCTSLSALSTEATVEEQAAERESVLLHLPPLYLSRALAGVSLSLSLTAASTVSQSKSLERQNQRSDAKGFSQFCDKYCGHRKKKKKKHVWRRKTAFNSCDSKVLGFSFRLNVQYTHRSGSNTRRTES